MTSAFPSTSCPPLSLDGGTSPWHLLILRQLLCQWELTHPHPHKHTHSPGLGAMGTSAGRRGRTSSAARRMILKSPGTAGSLSRRGSCCPSPFLLILSSSTFSTFPPCLFVIQSLSRFRLFATAWTAARQASLYY